MKCLFVVFSFVIMLFSLPGFGQVGEKVISVKIQNSDRTLIDIPFLGEKNLLIFYADPGRPRQNKSFRDYFKTHPINSPNIASYGIVNLAAPSVFPNSMIRNMASKEAKGAHGKVYFDPDGVLASDWKLPGADKNFAVIFVNKERVIEFYKSGHLSLEDEEKVLALIQKYR